MSSGSLGLFGDAAPLPARQTLAPGALLLRGFVRDAAVLQAAIGAVIAQAPWRHMLTMRGYRMSVAMSNCGECGWISDRQGYRYSPVDPVTGLPWPAMPSVLRDLAQRAATAAGYDRFTPDACLINRYEPGASMGLHQDRNERDFAEPIVSVSLGVAATFLFGGDRRGDRAGRFRLAHGDVIVWGGRSRLNFHGIAKLPASQHEFAGDARVNLTYRKAG